MKVLSRGETSLWCHRHQIGLDDYGLPDRSGPSAKFDKVIFSRKDQDQDILELSEIQYF
jgi:hypothetical protein